MSSSMLHFLSGTKSPKSSAYSSSSFPASVSVFLFRSSFPSSPSLVSWTGKQTSRECVPVSSRLRGMWGSGEETGIQVVKTCQAYLTNISFCATQERGDVGDRDTGHGKYRREEKTKTHTSFDYFMSQDITNQLLKTQCAFGTHGIFQPS